MRDKLLLDYMPDLVLLVNFNSIFIELDLLFLLVLVVSIIHSLFVEWVSESDLHV